MGGRVLRYLQHPVRRYSAVEKHLFRSRCSRIESENSLEYSGLLDQGFPIIASSLPRHHTTIFLGAMRSTRCATVWR